VPLILFILLVLKYANSLVPLVLMHTKYTKDLLAKTNMLEARPVSSPMFSGSKLSKQGSNFCPDPSIYRSVVGTRTLQYVTHHYQAKDSFSVNKVCQFMSAPWNLIGFQSNET